MEHQKLCHVSLDKVRGVVKVDERGVVKVDEIADSMEELAAATGWAGRAHAVPSDCGLLLLFVLTKFHDQLVCNVMP